MKDLKYRVFFERLLSDVKNELVEQALDGGRLALGYSCYYVPEVLLNGNHAAIAAWRRREALRTTARLRPDLLKTAQLTEKERQELEALGYDVRV